MLRTRGGGCGQSKATVEEAAKEGTKADAAAPRARLSAAALARAEERYSARAEERYSSSLRALLTHDRARGGVPIKLLSARWLLEYFQAEDHAGERLEHRQVLERTHGEAPFVGGEALERVLRELELPGGEHGYYVSNAVGGEYDRLGKGGTNGAPATNYIYVAFPSAVALSHMWLDPSHPDPHAKNLRELWMPALEWYYAERIRQLTMNTVVMRETRAWLNWGRHFLSDEDVRSAADFGVFIDLASMCQKEGGQRTAVEEALFRHALQSLDIICARAPCVCTCEQPTSPPSPRPRVHGSTPSLSLTRSSLARGQQLSRARTPSLVTRAFAARADAHESMATLLSTRVPAGVTVARAYDDRG